MTHKVNGCKDCPLKQMALYCGEADGEYCGHLTWDDDKMIDTTIPYPMYMEENMKPEWCPLDKAPLALITKEVYP